MVNLRTMATCLARNLTNAFHAIFVISCFQPNLPRPKWHQSFDQDNVDGRIVDLIVRNELYPRDTVPAVETDRLRRVQLGRDPILERPE